MINPKTGEPYEGRYRPTDGKFIQDYIDPGIVKKLKKRGERTPDISQLKFFKEIPLFVYGTEMVGGEDSDVLEGAKYLGKAHSLSTNFVMKANNAFPIVFPVKVDTQMKGRVRGEMYLVTPEHIIMMDQGNSNGRSFNRVRSRFILEDQEDLEHLKCFKQEPYMPAFFYIGSTTWWGDKATLSTRPRHSYSGSTKTILVDKWFFEWNNFPDDENDEWGYYGNSRQGNFWGRNVRSH